MNNAKIILIDQTIREGMQHRGIVFSSDQRKTIARFQEKLGVDICQAGYPPAHTSEQESVRQLTEFAAKENFSLKIAGMGRASAKDAAVLAETGVADFHLHAFLPPDSSEQEKERFFSGLDACVSTIRNEVPAARISLAMLDIGRTPSGFLEKSADFLIHRVGVDILSLPDTSGIIAPNLIYDCISPVVLQARETATRISVHCHNDMGMAGANTIMGVMAGATVVEASALGIGERNGMADLFTTGKMLKDQGFLMNLDTEALATFKAYYDYVSDICREQTGDPLLSYNTPFFGDAVKTHVAGTHATTAFGLGQEEKFFLNTLCGKHLVKKYLEKEKIPYNKAALPAITQAIKNQSASRGRRLKRDEIRLIATEH